MGKQIKIFDLLSKKQSLTVFRSQKRKNKLSEELTQVLSYQSQLLKILESVELDKSNKTVSEIKSEAWYNFKIQDELIAVKNKIDFLSLEIKNQNIEVALATEKHRRFKEKKRLYNKIERQEKENKRESAMHSSVNNRSKPLK